MPGELSPREAAHRVGAHPRSVQRWIAAGRLPARRVGGRWRVAIDALDAFVAAATPASALPGSRRAPVRRLFVANRGEIARRIAASARAIGVDPVVPGMDGAGPVDLLDGAACVAAARLAGCDAIHPGYGFLAESAAFAERVESAGLAWIGPPASAIRRAGDKAAARRLAASVGVPVVPGYDGPDLDDAALVDAARRLGPPLVVKPAAGGGGKGMRVVRDLDRLADALASARREARAAFGDDRLLLERLAEGPRHVEVQVLFDALGAGVHLGERDCSLQRRHQKVLEESPSPAVGPALRARLGDAALRIGEAVGYRSAGTCEFLLGQDGSFFFLEMNTRLQVEHPVTELVTGRDLVADQLAIAAGATLGELGLDQATIDRALAGGGHAIEARLYAEDAEAGFLPATGRVVRLRWPGGAAAFGPAGEAGVRVDSGVDEGMEIGGRFDPMLAKVIVHGRDRTDALGRLAAALDSTLVLGLVTNLRFLRWLVRQPVVAAGDARVDTLERIWPPDGWTEHARAPEPAWQAAAAALLAGGPGVGGVPAGGGPLGALPAGGPGAGRGPVPADPWSGGWRLNSDPVAWLVSDDATERPGPRRVAARIAPGQLEVCLAGATAFVDVAGRSVAFRLAPPPELDRQGEAASAGGGSVTVGSPMPGSVVRVEVAVGDRVGAGDPLVVVEAMKMEHVVSSPIDGLVAAIAVVPGDQVQRGQPLARIEP